MQGLPPIRVRLRVPPWVAAVVLGSACVGAGVWGFLTESAANQTLIYAIAYFWLPLLMLALIVVSLGRRRWAILTVLALLDVEAALLGAGPPLALPFVVAVPLLCVAVAARNIRPQYMLVPYLGSWLASSAGVAIAVLTIIDTLNFSAIVVIPAFMFVDALALALLWHLDATRSRAVSEAAAADATLRDLLQGVELVGVHINRDSRIDFVNDYALKLTGWTRAEVLGRDWYDTFVPANRREAARARYLSTVAGDPVTALERRRESTLLTKSGETRLIRWSHVNRYDQDGRLAGVASLGEDITAIRAAEDAARRGAEMLSTLVVSSPLPTAVLGLDRKVQLWNPAVAELLGYPESEVLGRRVPPVHLGPDRWAIARTFIRALKGHPIDHDLLELSRRDGSVVRVRLYGGVLLDRSGRPMAVGLQAVDVTQAMAIEEQLREAQKMEAVGRLAGGVAHDFNNSLTAIGGFASLIAADSNDPESREAAETILAASQHAADLTRELLAYSRKSMLQPQIIDVNEMVGAIRPMLRRLIGEDVSVVIESNAPGATVRADRGGLERVLLNLAANARDAMPGGGRLTISTERRAGWPPPDTREADWVAVSVADTGAGIPFELHSQVFDPFFTTKPVGSGTGLGLAMVKGFVAQSGGRVALRSEPGRGTTIEIMLPEVVDTRDQVPVVAEPGRAHGNETVLVVEDDPAVAGASFQVLTRAGYRVLMADDGENAIGLLRGHAGPIAIMVVDVILPDVRGSELAALAQELHPESVVLFASGYSADFIGGPGGLPVGASLLGSRISPISC